MWQSDANDGRFQGFLGLPRIQRAIDATQIHIQKPKSIVFVANYYLFKSKNTFYNFKWLLIIRKGSLTSLLGCKGPWMMQDCWVFLPFIEMLHGKNCSMDIICIKT
jgi:hypothetical protein